MTGPGIPSTLAEAAAALAAGTLTARALAEAQLARVAATDAAIEAWAHLDPADVRAAADACDAQSGERGALCGIGVGVKDIVDVGGVPTRNGSPIFADNVPARDATLVARLRAAGGYVFGKTVTTELAYFHPGKTRNPWNATHTPGGSSSGSAAAVAAGHVLCAVGTQTNGSVIRPAAFCGVIGFKPTKGAIPCFGVQPFSETLDQAGTFARDVAGAARLASALADPGRIVAEAPSPRHAPSLALLAGFPWTSVGAEAAAALETAAARLRAAGAEVVPVEYPKAWRDARDVHRTIMLHEAAAELSALQRRERGRMSAALNAALDEGATIPRGVCQRALARRDAAVAAFAQWLAGFDAVISPAADGPAPEGLASTGDPACCTLWSLTGFPAIALPVGRAANGLPLAVQIAAPIGADSRLVGVAAWCEARLPFEGLR